MRCSKHRKKGVVVSFVMTRNSHPSVCVLCAVDVDNRPNLEHRVHAEEGRCRLASLPNP